MSWVVRIVLAGTFVLGGRLGDSRVVVSAAGESTINDRERVPTTFSVAFEEFTGTTPQVSHGTAAPVFSRTTVATYRTGDTMYTAGVGVPRISDFPDGSRGYLAEDDGQNILIQSEDASTSWSSVRLSVLTNTLAAPDGAVTMDTLHEDATAATSHYNLQGTLPVTDTHTYVFSRFMAPANRSWVVLQCQATPVARAYFNVSTGAMGDGTNETGISAKHIEKWGSTYRIAIVFTATATGNIQCGNWVVSADGADINAIDGLNQDSYYAWGGQLEEGAYPTSYIKTNTVAVSRDDDGLYYVGDDGNLYGVGSEKTGKIQIEFTCPDYDVPTSSQLGLFSLTDGGTTAERLNLRAATGAADYLAMTISTLGVVRSTGVGLVDVFDGARHSVQIDYVVGSASVTLDGTSDITEAPADIPDDIDRITVGMHEASQGQPGCLIHRVSHTRWP